MLTYQISTGIGVWGNMHPVMWGWDIINFVWWIGIGHAGTLISAILFLLRQRWRTAVNRAAEAMTIFAVMCAGIYPAMHVGRVWFDWWLFPIPTSTGMWPQFRSPLMWDVFAVSTYFTVSVLFWYTGLIPDLATMRDRAKTKLRKFIYSAMCFGWTGSNRHWSNYEKAYLILAGLSTPLVLSVHSIVSLDSCVSHSAGLAHDDLPAVFRRGRGVLRIRDGIDAPRAAAQVVQAGGHHHDATHRRDVQSHIGHRLHRWIRLLHGVFHRVVQRQSVRTIRFHEPLVWTVLVWRLGDARVQRVHPAIVLVQEMPDQPVGGVRHLDPRQRRHVV
jgi:hypothetical protein